MKKIKFKIATTSGIIKREGYEVKLKGFEEYKFAVHLGNNGYTVTELSTGKCFPIYGASNRTEAKMSAEMMLEQLGKQKFKKELLKLKKIE